jgi:hypothetical protein
MVAGGGPVRANERTHAPQQTTALFDHLVGACEQRRRHRDAECFGGFQIDRQLVFGWGLRGQIGGLLAFKYAIDVTSGALILVDHVRPIGDQAAGGDEEASEVDCGQLMIARQSDDQLAMLKRQCGCGHDQTAIR